jgi:predicted DNA-binding protein
MKEQLMKRTMIYLPEQTHEGLRKLAFEANTSIAELIRQAIDAIYSEDIEDIQDMEEELIKYQAHPESAIELQKYLRQRKAHVSA